MRRWPLTVNNNKPGDFVSSSGNFFDLASYFFRPRMRLPDGPGPDPSRPDPAKRRFSAIRVDGCGPEATGLPVSVDGGYPTATASEATTAPQYFALGGALPVLPDNLSIEQLPAFPLWSGVRGTPFGWCGSSINCTPSLLVPLPF